MVGIAATHMRCQSMAHKPISSRLADVAGAPEGMPFVMHTIELLRSNAWRGLSINCRRLLEFLEVEHMQHAGLENGRLLATYDQLIEWGITRRLVKRTIEEAERRKLVEVHWGALRANAKNNPTRFRLTYLASSVVNEDGKTYYRVPTDDWHQFRVTKLDVPEGEPKKAPRRNHAGSRSETAGAKDSWKSAVPKVPNEEHPSISRVGVAGGPGGPGSDGAVLARTGPQLSTEQTDYLRDELRLAARRWLKEQGRGANKRLAAKMGISPEHLSNYLANRAGLNPDVERALIQEVESHRGGARIGNLVREDHESCRPAAAQ
jgi:hypothetical protein